MGFSVDWKWIAAFLGLLNIGDVVWCDCSTERIRIVGGNYTLSNQFKEGSILRYQCAEGYYPYPALTLKCQFNNLWDPKPRSQSCKLVQCPDPTVLENGHVSPISESREYFFKNQITYECYSGYDLNGPSQRTCLSSGKWSGSNPVCRRDSGDCPDPGIPPGGRKSGNIYEIGDKVTYECRRDMILIGSEERVCQLNGQWSGHEPTCYYKHTYDSPWEVSQAFGGEIKNTISLLVNKTQGEKEIKLTRDGILNIYIGVDISESIEEKGYKNATKAALALITKIEDFSVHPNYEVVFFASEIHEVINIIDFSEGKQELIHYLNNFRNYNITRGKQTGTNLNAVFRFFLEKMAFLKKQNNFNEHHHVIILFTDGGYNMGGAPTQTVNEIKSLVYMNQEHERKEHLDIYIFAVGNPVYDEVLKPLTVGVGTRHYFRLKDVDGLDKIFEEIINEDDVKGLCGLFRDYGNEDIEERRKKFPWVMYLTVMADGKSTNCLGSLVSPRFVLTAAHCIKMNSRVSVEGSESQVLEVKNFHIHPNYNIDAKKNKGVIEFYDYDVALIELQEDAPIAISLRPICIPCTEETNGALRKVMTCKEQEQFLIKNNEKLTFLTKKNLGEKEAHVKLGENRHGCIEKAVEVMALNIRKENVSEVVTENFLCTGGRHPYLDKISCKGDSGGAVFKNYERRTIQVALVSWGTHTMPACSGDGPVNSNDNSRDFHINLFKVLPFLKSILGKQDQPYAPITFVD